MNSLPFEGAEHPLRHSLKSLSAVRQRPKPVFDLKQPKQSSQSMKLQTATVKLNLYGHSNPSLGSFQTSHQWLAKLSGLGNEWWQRASYAMGKYWSNNRMTKIRYLHTGQVSARKLTHTLQTTWPLALHCNNESTSWPLNWRPRGMTSSCTSLKPYFRYLEDGGRVRSVQTDRAFQDVHDRLRSHPGLRRVVDLERNWLEKNPEDVATCRLMIGRTIQRLMTCSQVQSCCSCSGPNFFC